MMALKLWHAWTCKGPDVPRLIVEWGGRLFNAGKIGQREGLKSWTQLAADCHDTTPKDFAEGKPALRIARPHVLRALDALKSHC